MLEWEGIRLRNTSVYHPQSNPSERCTREFGRMFRTYVHHQHTKWPEYISFIEKCLNFPIHDTTNCIPYQLMFRKKSPNFYENLVEYPNKVEINFDDKIIIARNNLKIKAKARAKSYDKTVKPIKYEVNDLILVKIIIYLCA